MHDQAGHVVEAYASTLQAAGSQRFQRELLAVASFLKDIAGRELPIPRKANKKAPKKPNLTGEVAELSSLLQGLAKQLDEWGAEKPLTNRLSSLAKVFAQAPESETLASALDKLRAEMSPDYLDHQIASFIGRLTSSIGTDVFETVFAELEASALKPEHVAKIAKAVYGSANSSISRKKALELIRKPHDARLSARRGIEASGGRSAA